MTIKAVDTVRTPDSMDAADKDGVEGRWLDVPRLPAQNPACISQSSFWSGRAAAAMVYDFFCKADKKDSEYIGHDDGDPGPGPNGAKQNLRYLGGSQKGKLAGIDDGGKIDVQRVFTAAGMQVDGGNYVKAGETALPEQAERRLAPVLDQLKKNNPVLLFTAMAKGEGGHVVVCGGYKKTQDGQLWLRIVDPDAPKPEYLGGRFKTVTVPAGPEAMFSEYWMLASQLFQLHPSNPAKRLYSFTGNPGRYLYVVREKPIEESSELVHKPGAAAPAGKGDEKAADDGGAKSDAPAAADSKGDSKSDSKDSKPADGKKDDGGGAQAAPEKKKEGTPAPSGRPIEEIEADVIAGLYKDAGLCSGAAFKHADLKKLCEKYCQDDSIDPAAMAETGGKSGGGGDGETTSASDLPLWYTTWREKVCNHPKWDTYAQGRSRLGEAFSRAFFRKLIKDKGLKYPPSADEHFANLWKSTSASQTPNHNGNGKSPDMGGPSGIYCAAAGSLGFERGLNGNGWFLTDHKIGTQAARQCALGSLKNQPKPLPGDVLSIVSAGTPRTGHVVTVVCPLTDNYDGGDCWVVSGNTSPSGAVALDLYHFEKRDPNFNPFKQDENGKLVGQWQGDDKRPTAHKVWVYANQACSDYYPDALEGLDDAARKKLHVKKGEKKETPGTKPGKYTLDDAQADAPPAAGQGKDDKKDGAGGAADGGGAKKDDGKGGAADGGAAKGDAKDGGGAAPPAKAGPPKPKPKNDGPPPPAACPPKTGTPRLPVAVDSDITITGAALTSLYHQAERGNGGYFPLGDSGLFHSGVHLMPDAGADAYAIADGEMVAARIGTGPGVHPWGDTGFVLTRHVLKGDKTIYSLLVHLKKETLHPDRTEAGWLKRLLIAAMGGEPPKKTKWQVKENLPTWTDDDKGKFSPTTVKQDKPLAPGIYEEEDQVFLDHKHYVKLKGAWVRGSGGAGDETRIKELSPWSSFDLETACKNSAIVKTLNDGKTAVLDTDKDKDGKHKWTIEAGEVLGTTGNYHDSPSLHWSIFSKDAVFPSGDLLDEEWGQADEVKLKSLDLSGKDTGSPESGKAIVETIDPDKKVFGVEKDESVVMPVEVRKFYRAPTLCWRARYHSIKGLSDFKLDVDKLTGLDRYKSHSQDERDDFKTNAKAFVFWDDLSSAEDFPTDGNAVFVHPVTAVRLMTSVAVAQDHDDPKDLAGGVDRLHADEDVVISLRDKAGPLAAAKITIKGDGQTIKSGQTDAAGELIVQLEDLANHDVQVSVDEQLLGKDGMLVSLLNETGGPVKLQPGDAPGNQSFNGKDVVPDPKMKLPMRVKKGATVIPYQTWNANTFQPESPVSQQGLPEGTQLTAERIVFRREDAKFEAVETHLDGNLTYLWSIQDGNALLDVEPPKTGDGNHKDPAIHATWSQRMAHVNEHPVLAGRVENIDDGKELELTFFAMMAVEGPEHDVELEKKKIKIAAGGLGADFDPAQLAHGQGLMNAPRPVFAKIKLDDKNTISLRDQAVTIYAADAPFPSPPSSPAPEPSKGDGHPVFAFSEITRDGQQLRLTTFDGKPAPTRKLKDIGESVSHRFTSEGGWDELYVGAVTTMPHLPTEAEARMKPAEALAHHKAETLKAEPDAPAWIFADPASAASGDNGIASGLCATHCKTKVSDEGVASGCNDSIRVKNLSSCHNAHHGGCQQAVDPIQIGKPPVVKGCGGYAGSCGEVGHDKSKCFVTDPVLGANADVRERWSVALPMRVKDDKSYDYKGNLRVVLVNPANGKAVVASQELRGPAGNCETHDEQAIASVKQDEFKDQGRIAALSYEVTWRLGLSRSGAGDNIVLLAFVPGSTPLGPLGDDKVFRLRKSATQDQIATGAAIPDSLEPPRQPAPKPGAPPPAPKPQQSPPPHKPPVPAPAPAAAAPPPDPGGGKALVGVRRQMVAVAKGEVGKVDDRGGEGGKRKGWEELKDYLEKALGVDAEKQGWLPAIQKPGGRAGGLHWCGIFAVWCAIQSGLNDVKWKLGQGPTGLGRFRTDKNYAPGDILVCKGPLNHHCVLTAFAGDKLETVNGNSYYQSVSLANRDPGEIALYYRLSDQVYEG